MQSSALQLLTIISEGFACDLLSLLDRAVEMPAAGIEVSAAVEEAARHVLHREVVDRAQADPNLVVDAVVLTQRDADLHALDAQWLVDESLGIAALVVEVEHILACQRIVRSVEVLKDIEFLRHQIAAQADGPRAVVVEHVAIDLVLVYAFREQLTDDVEDLRNCQAARKTTSEAEQNSSELTFTSACICGPR